MISLFDDRLHEIDREIASTQAIEIPRLFADIPLDIFGYMLLDIPSEYPNIKAPFHQWCPMPSKTTGQELTVSRYSMTSLAFVKTVVRGYETITENDIVKRSRLRLWL